MNPILTSVKEDINEIISLRKKCWTTSYGKNFSSFNWFDKLDFHEHTLHWIVKHESEIIASARLSMISNLNEIPYGGVFKRHTLTEFGNIAFYSRLVVSPTARGNGLSSKLDQVRMDYINSSQIKLVIATARNWRIKKLKNLGWIIGEDVNPSDDINWNLGEAKIIKYLR